MELQLPMLKNPVRYSLRTAMLFCLVSLFASGPAWAQESEVQIQGEWRMELRVLKSRGLVLNQQNISLFVGGKLPDGNYRVLTHLTTHAIADTEGLLARPECRGKMECWYDDGSEGVGRLVGDKLYVDWLDEAWIDDIFTISGNRMTGDDGNGPLDFTKVE